MAARWISVILHPVFMPLYTLGLAISIDPQLAYFLPQQGQFIALMMIAVMTIAFPLTSTLLLLKAGMLSSLEMDERPERVAPFAMTLLYYGMTYYLLQRSYLHPAVLSIFMGIIVAMLMTILITLRWKISIHMVGIGGAAGAIVGLSVIHSLALLPIIAMIIILAGLLGTARLIAGTHGPSQIYTGMALGFVATYACVVLEIIV